MCVSESESEKNYRLPAHYNHFSKTSLNGVLLQYFWIINVESCSTVLLNKDIVNTDLILKFGPEHMLSNLSCYISKFFKKG